MAIIPLRPFVKNVHNAPLLTGMTRVAQCLWVGALFMCITTHSLRKKDEERMWVG
ncbi:hypothetical protein Hanom_Chr06g00533191 [Helianthus anomalus]